MISLHRLTQEAYYYHLFEKERHDTFHVAYRILCAAFPKRTLRRQMYEVWETCEMLIHHIETAQEKYEDLRPTGLNVQDVEYHTMLADAAWYITILIQCLTLRCPANEGNPGSAAKPPPSNLVKLSVAAQPITARTKTP